MDSWFFLIAILTLQSFHMCGQIQHKKDRVSSMSFRIGLDYFTQFWNGFASASKGQHTTYGHFTHETESPWPLHLKHSHWWKRWSWFKSTSYYAWGTNGACECKMDVKSTWIPTWHQMDHVSWPLGLFSKPPLGGRPNTKLWDSGTPYAHNRWFVLFYHVWGPAWTNSHWNNIWLSARSHMTLHYTWESVTTLHDFGGVLGQPLDTSFWALTTLWSRFLGSCMKWPWLERELSHTSVPLIHPT